MRYLLASFSIYISLLPLQGRAQEFVSEEPQAQKVLDFDEFENITKLLYAGKLAPHLKCGLKVRTIKEERKFSEGKKLVEVLEILYYPRGLFSDLKVKVLIPAQLATFGVKYTSNQWSGAGEDIKIEAHDGYDHWLRFIHDGKGNIVFFSLGNRLATYPCAMK
ncbi:MAG: hypothetical protein ACXVB1_07745 [Pseudobdellovibrionaceae bacterium]